MLKRLPHEFNCGISTDQTKCCFNLKVLSSEMTVAESTVDREEVFHKERGAEVFIKICPYPSL